MGEYRHRSLLGPLLLILVGIALLLGQLGLWSINWGDLWRFWPLLLILAGLDVLLRRARWGGVVSLLVAGLVIVLGVALLLPTAVFRRQDRREVVSYPAAGLQTANVRIQVGTGNLRLAALDGSENLVEADITYDTSRTRLDNQMEVAGSEGRVVLKATHPGTTPGLGRADQWNVRLNPRVPTRLDVVGGVNRVDLDLQGLMLTRLNLTVGVGEARVVLADKGRYEASIDGGVGTLRVEIPPEIEARIRVDGGLGSVEVDPRFRPDGRYYVTEGYDRAEQRVDVDINGGIGSIVVK